MAGGNLQGVLKMHSCHNVNPPHFWPVVVQKSQPSSVREVSVTILWDALCREICGKLYRGRERGVESVVVRNPKTAVVLMVATLLLLC